MRLTDEQVRLIRQTTTEQLGPNAAVVLFGSRVDDTLRGGDVDLLVKLPKPVPRPALTAAQLAARLERVLGGRRVDVVLLTPDTPIQPVHRIAIEHGVPL